jgi:hypothetical protein
VEDAARIICHIAELAGRRGRDTLRVVHGSSTSDPLARTRTIRHTVHDLLDGGRLRPWVVDSVRYDDYAILSLGVSRASRPGAATARLTSADLYAPLR